MISVFAVCGVDDVPIGNREPLLSDGPVSVRFVVSLLKLLVAAESKYASFSFIAFATAVLSSCCSFQRMRRRSHLRLHLLPGVCRTDFGLGMG